MADKSSNEAIATVGDAIGDEEGKAVDDTLAVRETMYNVASVNLDGLVVDALYDVLLNILVEAVASMVCDPLIDSVNGVGASGGSDGKVGACEGKIDGKRKTAGTDENACRVLWLVV